LLVKAENTLKLRDFQKFTPLKYVFNPKMKKVNRKDVQNGVLADSAAAGCGNRANTSDDGHILSIFAAL